MKSEVAMAYCDNCGAYIPDGHTVCLACGFDEESARKEKTAAAAAAAQAEEKKENPKAKADYEGAYYSFTNEELKERLAQQRKRQQEESRRWAEEEKARREARREAEEKYDPETGRSSAGRDTISGSKSGDSKLLSAISYLGILFLIPMIFRHDDEYAAFHAKQGLGLFVYNIVAGILNFVPLLGVAMKLFGFYCIYKGMSSALKGKLEELPYIGRFFR